MITQYGVLAYERGEDGDPRFLLITSRDTKRWVIPRGNPIKRLSPWLSAAQEAYEEAGLTGYVSAEEIGAYRYQKHRKKGTSDPAEVHVFPLYVTRQSRHWPERHQRETRWFTREEAIEAVDENSLKELIRDFQPSPNPATGIATIPVRPLLGGSSGRRAAAPFAMAFLAFLWLAMFLLGGTDTRFDPAILSRFYARDHAALADLARFVTDLGGWLWLSLISAAFALYLIFRRELRRALIFLAIVVSGRLVIDAQKILSARGRPEEEHLVAVHSLSFPSAHSGNSVITYFAIALLAAPLVRKSAARRGLFIAAALICLTVGLSRMMLGVHWPSDVLGGWAFGLLWTFGLVRLAEHVGTPSRLRH